MAAKDICSTDGNIPDVIYNKWHFNRYHQGHIQNKVSKDLNVNYAKFKESWFNNSFHG